jgi:hypothetical protein
MHPRYILDRAESCEAGIRKICNAIHENKPYDAIVWDLRFGPLLERRGYEILKIIFSLNSSYQPEGELPEDWKKTLQTVKKDTLGILSIESVDLIVADLNKWNIPIDKKFCRQKKLQDNPELLLDLFYEITGQ